MKLGYFMQPVHPPERNYREVLMEDREAVILADQLGYVEAFVGEHITDKAEPITSCLAFLASLMNDAPNITLGSGVVNLPSYHPAMVAAQVAMIDHLLDGRFIFGIGPGGLMSDVEVFGNLDLDKNDKMVEAMDQILAIWAGEPPYNLTGKYFTTSLERTTYTEIGQGIIATPLQKPHPPVAITSVAPHSDGLSKAVERGWIPMSSNYVQAHWVATNRVKILAGLKNAGKPETTDIWRIAKSIFVADDEATALRYGKSADGPYGFYFTNIMKKIIRNGRPHVFKISPDQPDEDISLEQSLETQVIAGTVNSVVDQILALHELIGGFGTLMYTGHDWADVPLARRSMELMATEVMPRVNAALGEAEAAQ